MALYPERYNSSNTASFVNTLPFRMLINVSLWRVLIIPNDTDPETENERL
jgi:hypothetical protein